MSSTDVDFCPEIFLLGTIFTIKYDSLGDDVNVLHYNYAEIKLVRRIYKRNLCNTMLQHSDMTIVRPTL